MKEDAQRNSRSLNAHFVKILQLYFDGELVAAKDLAATPGVRAIIREATQVVVRELAESLKKPK